MLGYGEIIPPASTEQPKVVNKCQELGQHAPEALKKQCGSSDRQTDKWTSKNLVLMWWYS